LQGKDKWIKGEIFFGRGGINVRLINIKSTIINANALKITPLIYDRLKNIKDSLCAILDQNKAAGVIKLMIIDQVAQLT